MDAGYRESEPGHKTSQSKMKTKVYFTKGIAIAPTGYCGFVSFVNGKANCYVRLRMKPGFNFEDHF